MDCLEIFKFYICSEGAGATVIAVRFEQIIPEEFREGLIRLYLLTESRKIARDIRHDFQETTKTWNHKVKFEIVTHLAGGTMESGVETSDPIYVLVNDGSKASDKPIEPQAPRRALRFHGTYSAKTSPGVIGSKKGGGSGDIIFAKHAERKEVEARDFEGAIERKWEPLMEQRFQEAFDAAAVASGYEI